jgi:hypothetical protein
VLGHLAADQGAARLAAALGDAADDRLDLPGIETPDRDVVEEVERLGARHQDVVDAHRDQVDPDGVVTAREARDLQLGPDAVGRRDQDGLAVFRRHAHQTGEAADPADHLGAVGRARERRDAAHRIVARVDVDAGLAIGKRLHVSSRRG